MPSGTKWATMNVGASKPSDAGLYFQWGDTQGYTKDQVGTSDGHKKFSWADYKWNPSGDEETFTKYTTTGSTLDLEDDAAHVHMGGDWHMPTDEQFQELINNTTSYEETEDGVNGITLISNNDTSKSIFIPKAGEAIDGSVENIGSDGGIWEATLSNVVNMGLYARTVSDDIIVSGWGKRSNGYSVRGVID